MSMNNWIKIILPNGVERYVRKIEFGHGFQVTEDKYGINVSNINYEGGIDYEFAKNIFDITKYEWKSVVPNDKWNNAIVYAVHNKSSEETVTFVLHLNTIWPITNGSMKPDLSDVLVINEDGEILSWYYSGDNAFGEFDIVVTDNIPQNGIKNYFIVFGNSKCLGVFKKPQNASIVKLPFNLDSYRKYSIYPLSNQDIRLNWTTDGNNGYIDVSSLSDGSLFVVELDNLNGTTMSEFEFDVTNAVDVEKIQWLKPEPQITENVKTYIVRNQFLSDWPYYWCFDVTNEDTQNPLEGPICIEFDSTELISKGIMKPNANDLRVAIVDQYGNPIRFLDYYVEHVTIGTDKTRVWTELYISPSSTIRLALLFDNPYVFSESDGNKVMFKFFDEFIVKYSQPNIFVETLEDGTYRVTIHNPYEKRIFYPIKLPIKAPNELTGYEIVPESE